MRKQMNVNKMEIKTKERGWKAHLCVGDKCKFSRNTLVGEYPDAIIVSTVGLYFPSSSHDEPYPIGSNGRLYETMMFVPVMDGEYIDIDPSMVISFDGKQAICEMHDGSDNEANDMHDGAVDIAKKLVKRELANKNNAAQMENTKLKKMEN